MSLIPALALKAMIFGAITGLAALVANRALSAYHDGLRPLMPEYRRGDISHGELRRKVYILSIGFVLYYALPFTLATGIMVSHTVFLAADLIGVAIGNPYLSGLAGAAYGATAVVVLDTTFLLLHQLPVNFMPHLLRLVEPLRYLIGLMPVMAVAHLYGIRLGSIALAMVILTRIVGAEIGMERWLTSFTPDGLALLAGSVFLIALVARRRTQPVPNEAQLFADNIRNLRRGLPYLVLIGMLSAVAANFGWLGGEPAATLLLGDRRLGDAAMVALFSAIGYMPLVVGSSLVTGAYSTQGYPDWILGAGYVSPSPLTAAVAGAGLMITEVLGVLYWSRLLGRFGDLREVGPAVRDALIVIPEISMLIGGVLAAHEIWAGYGALLVAGFYVLNEAAGRPIMRLAIGPVGAITVGLAVNVLAIIGAR